MNYLYKSTLLLAITVTPALSVVTVNFTDITTTPTAIDLTALGTIDWVKASSVNSTLNAYQKDTGTNINFSTSSLVAGSGGSIPSAAGNTDGNLPASWTDGPVGFVTSNGEISKWEYQNNNVGATAGDDGYEFTVDGLAIGTYKLSVWVSKFRSNANFVASIDGTGAASDSEVFTTGGNNNSPTRRGFYDVTFDVANTSDVLTLQYLMTANGGGSSSDNLGLYQIALTQIVPEPSSSLLIFLGGISFVFCRRRKHN